MEKRLELSKDDRMLLGVCSGLSKYTNTDNTVWRIGFLILSLPFPVLIFAYFLFALVMSQK